MNNFRTINHNLIDNIEIEQECNQSILNKSFFLFQIGWGLPKRLKLVCCIIGESN